MRGRGCSILAAAACFSVPATLTYVALKILWPQRSDLSDIATGLMRDVASLVVGLMGLGVWAIVRTKR